MEFDPTTWVEQIEGIGCHLDVSPDSNEIGYSLTDPSAGAAIELEVSKLNPEQLKVLADYLRQRGQKNPAPLKGTARGPR
jgi:hypothetical protein